MPPWPNVELRADKGDSVNMYHFQPETDFQSFDQFVEDHHGQYQQCSLWPKVKTGWNSHLYSGFDDNGTRVLTALVLERKLPLAGKLWYVPYGTVSDYTNAELQKAFADFIKGEMKKNGAFCVIIDPPVKLRINGEEQKEGHAAHRLLIGLGYQLNTDLDSYTYKHPVQTMIPLHDAEGKLIPANKILKGCEKGVRYSVRVGKGRGLKYQRYTWEDIEKNPELLDEFILCMNDTSERNSFTHRDKEYLTNLIRTLKDYTDITTVYYDKKIDTELEQQRLAERAQKVKALETAPQKKIKGLKNDIQVIDNNTKNYEARMEETKDYPADACIPVGSGLTIRYGGFASCVFGGSRNIVRNQTRSSHYLNYLRICESIDENMDYHDLGYVLCDNPKEPGPDGVLGKCEPRENFKGIASFKESFGAQYTEYIGEYILIGSKFRYWIYKNLMPVAKHIKMKTIFFFKRGKND